MEWSLYFYVGSCVVLSLLVLFVVAQLMPKRQSGGDKYERSDREYIQRLSEEFRKLKEANRLVESPPDWVPNGIPDDDDLQASPRLQAALAACTAYTPSKWLLERELSARDSSNPSSKSWSRDTGEDVFDAAAREGLAGLCFSGGGIRSATFCLGILQALAKNKMLGKFDYLSTVSGGGYIHQWLASWIWRDSGGLKAVESKLPPLPVPNSPSRTPDAVSWLRRYSSYLTPQRGILSADTWTMVAIWFRNTFLNQIVLFSFLACCLSVIRTISFAFVAPERINSFHPGGSPSSAPMPLLQLILVASLLILTVASICFIAAQLWRALASVTARSSPNTVPSGAMNNVEVVGFIVAPSFILTILVALESVGRIDVIPNKHFPVLLGCFFLFVLALNLAITFGGKAHKEFHKLSHKLSQGWFIVAMTFSIMICTSIGLAPAAYLADLPGGPGRFNNGPARMQCLATKVFIKVDHFWNRGSTKYTVQQQLSLGGESLNRLDLHVSVDNAPIVPNLDHIPERIIAIFGPVLLLVLQFLAIRLNLGIIGRFYAESRREWLSRFGAWTAIFCFGWIVLTGIALLGPPVFQWFFSSSTVRPIVSCLSVIAVHVLTLYAGGSGKSDGKPKPGTVLGYSLLDLVGIVGAPVCILSLLIIVAGLNDVAIRFTGGSSHPALTLALSVWDLVLLIIFGWSVDVNEFSMHGFYRNRLARCYLGATDRDRVPDPFTGFDQHDTGVLKGIALSSLLPQRFGGASSIAAKPYDGPFPIFCSTINLTFGEDIGWQDRKGASFAFTPLYSGYHVPWTAELGKSGATSFNGFVRTNEYAYPGAGIALSTVTAISGAALSPNQGYSSTPALAFLMTVFNVRLGWWLANPRKPGVWPSVINRPTPWFGLIYLLSELFGLSSDKSKYICLCDGGRFENMGLYELVRRRCKLIVICDSEQDQNMVFEGIGEAIAKCRADFGAEIDLKLQSLIPDTTTGRSSTHFVKGSIQYPAPPGKPQTEYRGTIFYLKTTFVGDETGDILHHKLTCPEFPQDSTLNQWFTESQFESYRRLGQLVAESAIPEISKVVP